MNPAAAPPKAHTARRACATAVTALAFLAPALAAQSAPRYEDIPVIAGAQRDKKAEQTLLAAAGPGERALKVYRFGGSVEQIFRYYVSRLGAVEVSLADVEAPEAGTSGVAYQVRFHSFEDECVEPPAAAGADCRRWRRGQDKRNALQESRVAYEPDLWVEAASFLWMRRGPGGEVERLRVEVNDVGLSPDWRHSSSAVQVIAEKVVLPAAAR
jgi:hypothetical protein